MQTSINPGAAIPVVSVKCFWILDGSEKTFFKREIIKSCKGYFVREHNAWCIDNPSEKAVELIRSNGMVLQFRKYKENNL